MINSIKPAIHYGYTIVLCCCLIMGVNVGIAISCAGIFYEPVSTALGIKVGEFGLYASVIYLCSALMLPLAGKLMEKFGARIMLSLNSALMGLCYLVMPLFNNVWQFYLAGGIIGITLAFLLYLSFPTLINRWFQTRVGFFIGVCSAASGIGGIIFNPFGAWLITTYGWRMAYCVFGLIILLLVTPVLGILLRDNPADKGLEPFGRKEIQNISADTGVEYAAAVKMPVFYALVLFAFAMIAVSTLNLFVPYYTTGLNYTLAQASLVAAAVMAGATAGKIILGMLNDKSGFLGITAASGCGILGLFLLLAGKYGFPFLLTGGFFFGWAYAAVSVETVMLVRHVFGGRHYARIYSNIAVALAAGGTLTAGGWGILADHTGFRFILILGIVLQIICGGIGIYALKTGKKLNSTKGETK